MNEYVLTLQVEPYLKQWSEFHLGSPVEFPRDSPESRLIKRFVDKLPAGKMPILEGNLRVKIPFSKEKDPRTYNYMSPAGLKIINESLMTLFLRNMWSELGDLNNVNCELTTIIYAYLEKHHISEEYWECIRQKYYRLRKSYAKKGIDLGK